MKSSHQNPIPEGTEENIELRHERIHKEGVGERRPRSCLGEGHEIPESDQHHHIDVLVSGVSIGIEDLIIIGLYPYKYAKEDDDYDFGDQKDDSVGFYILCVMLGSALLNHQLYEGISIN
jgi:hypothetical protein